MTQITYHTPPPSPLPIPPSKAVPRNEVNKPAYLRLKPLKLNFVSVEGKTVEPELNIPMHL